MKQYSLSQNNNRFQRHQLQIGTCQGHSLSASVDIKFCPAAAVDLQQALKRVQGGEWGTLHSRKTDVTGL